MGIFNDIKAIFKKDGKLLLYVNVIYFGLVLLGTLVEITIPSLVIPFWALLMGVIRAITWGVMLVIPVPGILK